MNEPDLLAEARALQRAGRFDEAERAHRRVLEDAPATLESLQFLSGRCFARGEIAAAADFLGRYLLFDPANLDAYHALGIALERLGRSGEAVDVLRQAYRRRPDHPQSLLYLGAALEKAGDEEGAAAAGTLLEREAPQMLEVQALRQAGAHVQERAGRLRAALDRFAAQVRSAAVSAVQSIYPEADLSRVAAAAKRPRFAPGAAERRRPEYLYVPGLPDEPWIEPERFEWSGRLQEAAPELAAEVAEALDLDRDGQPYVAAHMKTDPLWRDLAGRSDWSALHFWHDSVPNKAALAAFPKIRAALEGLPLVTARGRPVEAFLSVLRPRTRIPPHFGLSNYRLTVHLPLIVPEGCGVEVAGEARQTRFGRLMIFDDTYEHRAWNDSDRPRVVLIFEVWHPALSGAERTALAALLSRHDDFIRRRHALLADGRPGAARAEAALARHVQRIQAEPGDAEAWLRLIDLLVHRQRHEEAAQAASLAADKAPEALRLHADASGDPELREMSRAADLLLRRKLTELHRAAVGADGPQRILAAEWGQDGEPSIGSSPLERREAAAAERSAAARARWMKARRLPPAEIVVDRLGRAVEEAPEGAEESGDIRPATDADAPAVIELIAACFAQYPGCVMDLPGLDADLPQVATNFAQAGGEFWVAEQDGRIVACAGYTPKDAATVELKRLYVAPSARRRGLASRLLHSVLQAARRLGAETVELWSDTRFKEAHAFYLAHGFAQTGRTRKLNDPSDTTEYQFDLQLH